MVSGQCRPNDQFKLGVLLTHHQLVGPIIVLKNGNADIPTWFTLPKHHQKQPANGSLIPLIGEPNPTCTQQYTILTLRQKGSRVQQGKVLYEYAQVGYTEIEMAPKEARHCSICNLNRTYWAMPCCLEYRQASQQNHIASSIQRYDLLLGLETQDHPESQAPFTLLCFTVPCFRVGRSIKVAQLFSLE